MRYGIEIEAVPPRDESPDDARDAACSMLNRVNYCTYGYDASLPEGSIEAKPSRPLRSREVAPWVKSTTLAFKESGYRTTRACGLHIHLDRTSIQKTVLDDLALALGCWSYAAAYNAPSRVHPALFGTTPTRLNGGYAAGVSMSYIQRVIDEGAARLANHFLGVSYSTHYRTLEIRMPSGTICPKRILRIWENLRLSLAATKDPDVRKTLAALRGQDSHVDYYHLIPAVSNVALALENAVMRLAKERKLKKRHKDAKKPITSKQLTRIAGEENALCV